MSHFFAQVAELEKTNTPFALAVIVETKGSTPRHNAQMIVKTDGTIVGTVGGGMLERYIIKEALSALEAGQSRLVSGSLSRHGATALNMDCGGSVQVLINVFGQSPRLILVGGGHVNRAVAHLAHHLGFSISVLDTYAPNLSPELFPSGVQCILGDTLEQAVEQARLDSSCYVIIATNHEDRTALSVLAQQNMRYLGIMASRHKSQILLNILRENNLPEAIVQSIYSPIGLDIGAETPDEIAVSIMAEILSVKNQTTALPLNRVIPTQKKRLVVIRGAGEMATGVATRLYRAGFDVVLLDILEPTSIRNTVSFSQALEQGQMVLEGITAVKASNRSEVERHLKKGCIAVMVDPTASHIKTLAPHYVVDAILAKKNLGTHINLAPVVIALGPGFEAGKDCHAVIETNRGHHLGRVFYKGKAAENTETPGDIMGYSKERLIRAPADGILVAQAKLGQLVKAGDVIAQIDKTPVLATIDGLLRGLIHTGVNVHQGMKIGDIDPRGNAVDPFTVSDKARAIGGSVLEAMLYLSKAIRV